MTKLSILASVALTAVAVMTAALLLLPQTAMAGQPQAAKYRTLVFKSNDATATTDNVSTTILNASNPGYHVVSVFSVPGLAAGQPATDTVVVLQAN